MADAGESGRSPSPAEDQDKGLGEEVRRRFLERFLSDQEAGGALSLSEYQQLFPGYADLVSRVHAELCGDVAEQAHRLEIGALGQYRLLREIGRGGHGTVYLAEDRRLHRMVALKMLAGWNAFSPRMRARLQREAEMASRLDHPGICTVYEVGELEGAPFVAMQYVEGETLAAILAAQKAAGEAPESECGSSSTTSSANGPESLSGPTTRGAIPVILGMVEQVARALAVAHAAELIHRDIKPGNIIVRPEGEAVIVDFGLARPLEEDASSLTQSGQMPGTPAYMAAELIASPELPADARADVYALGVTLYECLTLRRPFEAATREQLYRQILDAEPPDPRRLNPRISRDLAKVLQVALEKEPDRRYQSALDLAEDLQRVRRSEPILARPPGAGVRAVRWMRRRPMAATALALVMICAPLITGLIVDRRATRERLHAAESELMIDEVADDLAHGFHLLAYEDRDDAVRMFEDALARCAEAMPQTLGGLAHAGLALARIEDPEAALAALDQRPDVPELGWIRSEVLRKAGRVEEADALEAGLGDPRSALGFFLLGTRALARGHDGREEAYEEALGFLTRGILYSDENHALDFALYCERAHAAGHCEDAAAATECADVLTTRWPESGCSWYWAGYALAPIDPERAIVAFREATSVDSEGSTAYGRLGLLLLEEGETEEAIRVLREAVRVKPSHASYYDLAYALEQMGDSEEAAAANRESIRLDPHCCEGPWRNLRRCLEKQGRLDDAITELRAAVAADRENFWAWYHLGGACFDKGLETEARDAYETALQLRPDDPEARVNLAAALGQTDEAIQHLESVLAAERDHPRAHCQLGLTFRDRGQLLEALVHLRKGHRLGSRRRYWSHPSGDWLEDCEERLILVALRGLREGFRDDAPDRAPDLGNAHDALHAVVSGWGLDLAAGADRSARIAERLARLMAREVVARIQDPESLVALPASERRRWRDLCSLLDRLRDQAGP